MGFGSLNGIKAQDPVVFFETPSYWDHSNSNPKYQVFGEKLSVNQSGVVDRRQAK